VTRRYLPGAHGHDRDKILKRYIGRRIGGFAANWEIARCLKPAKVAVTAAEYGSALESIWTSYPTVAAAFVRRRDAHLPVFPDDFELLRGKDALTVYTFETGVAQHTFCTHCGMHTFYVPRSQPDKITVNARCLDGIEGQLSSRHDSLMAATGRGSAQSYCRRRTRRAGWVEWRHHAEGHFKQGTGLAS